MLPEIVDMDLPFDGIFHNLAVVSIKKQYPQHARKVMYALWGLGQMMLNKVLVIVDAEVNVQNTRKSVVAHRQQRGLAARHRGG